MCDHCRRENPSCPFCNIKTKFYNTWFSKEKDKKSAECEAWIDFDQDENNEFLWYAILNGDQYTIGHTMVILGCHMDQITEKITYDELFYKKKVKLLVMINGINRVSSTLKERLSGVEAVHALCLCEGVSTHHLHFHLIPRYKYSSNEEDYFRKKYRKRAEIISQVKEFDQKFQEGLIHGMWYDAYQELHFVENEFNQKTKEERLSELSSLAVRLRREGISPVFNED